MRTLTAAPIAAAALAAALTLAAQSSAFAADAILSGTVKSASGEAQPGATVSARGDGATITTSVYTDAAGKFYFPPLPGGRYEVWAQALGLEASRATVDLAAAKRQDLVLKPLADAEARFRQLPGDALLAALPADTPSDHKMRQIFRNNCTGCHTPSYVLQHRFDEAGWGAIIELMKRMSAAGGFQGPDAKPNAIMDYNKKSLAAYLAKARGPGASAMQLKPMPRPQGEAARVVVREYTVPHDPELGVKVSAADNDGSDWALGTPARSGALLHDAWLDLDGQLWFTVNVPNRNVTVGRIDTATGSMKPFKVPTGSGLASTTHGFIRDGKGGFWFDVNPGRRSLGHLDPRTGAIEVYATPETMSPLGGAVTVDIDGKGKIWPSTPDGAVRFDPETLKFTEFKSPTFKTPHGNGMTYGAAGDRDGNGWWAQMPIDTIGKGDVATGKTSEIKLASIKSELDGLSAEERKVYDGVGDLGFNVPLPWQQGPRRMGTDKAADVLWVGDSWGGNLLRIDTHTLETSYVATPDPVSQQPYHVAVDKAHNAWTNMWNTDKIGRYDPSSKSWTFFELPSRGTEARYISLDETGGALKVVVPEYRTSKIAVVTFRTEADLAALAARAAN